MLSDISTVVQPKGTLTEGRLYADRFQGPFQGRSISDLEKAVCLSIRVLYLWLPSLQSTTVSRCICLGSSCMHECVITPLLDLGERRKQTTGWDCFGELATPIPNGLSKKQLAPMLASRDTEKAGAGCHVISSLANRRASPTPCNLSLYTC